MAVSSGLRWDEASLAVRLQDPRAEQLRIAGVTGSDAQNLERISAAVDARRCKAIRCGPSARRSFVSGSRSGGITIGADEIKVQFE